jgi:hypothetical protein
MHGTHVPYPMKSFQPQISREIKSSRLLQNVEPTIRDSAIMEPLTGRNMYNVGSSLKTVDPASSLPIQL